MSSLHSRHYLYGAEVRGLALEEHCMRLSACSVHGIAVKAAVKTPFAGLSKSVRLSACSVRGKTVKTPFAGLSKLCSREAEEVSWNRNQISKRSLLYNRHSLARALVDAIFGN